MTDSAGVTAEDKIDLLYKSHFGLVRTSSVETFSEPSRLYQHSRGDRIWISANDIPAPAAAKADITKKYDTTTFAYLVPTTTELIEGSTTLYQAYQTATVYVANATLLKESEILRDWVSIDFGYDYAPQIYADGTTGLTASKVQLFANGIGGAGAWVFFPGAGVLHFVSNTVPPALSGAGAPSRLYLCGYRYIGPKGTEYLNNIIKLLLPPAPALFPNSLTMPSLPNEGLLASDRVNNLYISDGYLMDMGDNKVSSVALQTFTALTTYPVLQKTVGSTTTYYIAPGSNVPVYTASGTLKWTAFAGIPTTYSGQFEGKFTLVADGKDEVNYTVTNSETFSDVLLNQLTTSTTDPTTGVVTTTTTTSSKYEIQLTNIAYDPPDKRVYKMFSMQSIKNTEVTPRKGYRSVQVKRLSTANDAYESDICGFVLEDPNTIPIAPSMGMDERLVSEGGSGTVILPAVNDTTVASVDLIKYYKPGTEFTLKYYVENACGKYYRHDGIYVKFDETNTFANTNVWGYDGAIAPINDTWDEISTSLRTNTTLTELAILQKDSGSTPTKYYGNIKIKTKSGTKLASISKNFISSDVKPTTWFSNGFVGDIKDGVAVEKAEQSFLTAAEWYESATPYTILLSNYTYDINGGRNPAQNIASDNPAGVYTYSRPATATDQTTASLQYVAKWWNETFRAIKIDFSQYYLPPGPDLSSHGVTQYYEFTNTVDINYTYASLTFAGSRVVPANANNYFWSNADVDGQTYMVPFKMWIQTDIEYPQNPGVNTDITASSTPAKVVSEKRWVNAKDKTTSQFPYGTYALTVPADGSGVLHYDSNERDYILDFGHAIVKKLRVRIALRAGMTVDTSEYLKGISIAPWGPSDWIKPRITFRTNTTNTKTYQTPAENGSDVITISGIKFFKPNATVNLYYRVSHISGDGYVATPQVSVENVAQTVFQDLPLTTWSAISGGVLSAPPLYDANLYNWVYDVKTSSGKTQRSSYKPKVIFSNGWSAQTASLDYNDTTLDWHATPKDFLLITNETTTPLNGAQDRLGANPSATGDDGALVNDNNNANPIGKFKAKYFGGVFKCLTRDFTVNHIPTSDLTGKFSNHASVQYYSPFYNIPTSYPLRVDEPYTYFKLTLNGTGKSEENAFGNETNDAAFSMASLWINCPTTISTDDSTTFDNQLWLNAMTDATYSASAEITYYVTATTPANGAGVRIASKSTSTVYVLDFGTRAFKYLIPRIGLNVDSYIQSFTLERWWDKDLVKPRPSDFSIDFSSASIKIVSGIPYYLSSGNVQVKFKMSHITGSTTTIPTLDFTTSTSGNVFASFTRSGFGTTTSNVGAADPNKTYDYLKRDFTVPFFFDTAQTNKFDTVNKFMYASSAKPLFTFKTAATNGAEVSINSENIQITTDGSTNPPFTATSWKTNIINVTNASSYTDDDTVNNAVNNTGATATIAAAGDAWKYKAKYYNKTFRVDTTDYRTYLPRGPNYSAHDAIQYYSPSGPLTVTAYTYFKLTITNPSSSLNSVRVYGSNSTWYNAAVESANSHYPTALYNYQPGIDAGVLLQAASSQVPPPTVYILDFGSVALTSLFPRIGLTGSQFLQSVAVERWWDAMYVKPRIYNVTITAPTDTITISNIRYYKTDTALATKFKVEYKATHVTDNTLFNTPTLTASATGVFSLTNRSGFGTTDTQVGFANPNQAFDYLERSGTIYINFSLTGTNAMTSSSAKPTFTFTTAGAASTTFDTTNNTTWSGKTINVTTRLTAVTDNPAQNVDSAYPASTAPNDPTAWKFVAKFINNAYRVDKTNYTNYLPSGGPNNAGHGDTQYFEEDVIIESGGDTVQSGWLVNVPTVTSLWLKTSSNTSSNNNWLNTSQDYFGIGSAGANNSGVRDSSAAGIRIGSSYATSVVTPSSPASIPPGWIGLNFGGNVTGTLRMRYGISGTQFVEQSKVRFIGSNVVVSSV